MPVKRRDKTTLLPQALREQLEQQGYKTGHSHSKRQKSRKERRTEEKIAKKQRKNEYYSHNLNNTRSSEPRPDVEPPKKRRKLDEGNTISKPLVTKRSDKSLKTLSPVKKDAVAGPKPLRVKMAEGDGLLKKTRSQVEIDEDKEIAWLEYQLGLSGKKQGKSWNKMLQEDGLDDLLDGLDDVLGGVGGSEDDVEGPAEDWDTEQESQDEEDEDKEDEEEEDDHSVEEDEPSKDGKSDASDVEMDDAQAVQVSSVTFKAEVADGSKYVPPHLRAAAANDLDATRARLQRQIRGMVNKLSEQNVATILNELEQVYRDNTRNAVTTLLTTVILDSIASNSSLLDSHVALIATLVASLYRIIGIEFVAHFVQELVEKYEVAYENARKRPEDDTMDAVSKEPLNLIVCLAELYNFGVISCVLVYDIIRQLFKETIGELEAELLLKILRLSGQQLRQDDPLALKDIVQMVLDNVAHRKGDLSSRTRFMIETLTNLKNNKVKKSDTSAMETVERMKKFLGTLSKRYHSSTEPLRVTLSDLHSSESKGKWWLVGAAWGGNPLVDHKLEKTSTPTHPESKLANQRLLQLAKSQGMNTDIRRSIFVVLMSSEDFFDACEKLGQLSLSEQQQREIIRVLLHCCGNEKTYNPYYALVGLRLCEQSHSYRITAQFSLWDFLRELGEDDVGGSELLKSQSRDANLAEQTIPKERIRNTAKLYAWWIAHGASNLLILKPLNFLQLKKQTRSFLDTLLYEVFVASQVKTPIISPAQLSAVWRQKPRDREALEKVALQVLKHAQLTKGLLLYLPGMEKRKLHKAPQPDEAGFVQWATTVMRDALETGTSLGVHALAGE